jgi:hypothetical protein
VSAPNVPAPPRKMSKDDIEAAYRAQGFNYLKHTDCPDVDRLHAKGFPKDFNPSTGLSKTHKQNRCPTCGYWSMWTPRGGDDG